MMHEVDVLVVGAGPVGSVAAYALAKAGVRVALCEAGATSAQDLRASTFHPPTLEILDELGVADGIIDYGLKAPIYHFRERVTGEIIEFDMSELEKETKFPFRIQCEQHVMAKTVTDCLLEEENATVLFNHRAVHVEQSDDHVVTSFETNYSIDKVKSKYVIACDGGNSIIRKWLDVKFDGFTYPEKFLCVSTKLELSDYIENLADVNYVADPEQWLVLLRTPNVWRVLVPAYDNMTHEELLSDETSDSIFSQLIGKTGVETAHRTIYQVHQRVVDRFNHGRIFLAGDAAHLNNPLGGFGMNSGIHDAWNLKEKIVGCLSNGHDEAVFDLYDRQRRFVTNSFIQAQTIQNKELLEHGAAEGHARRFQRMKEMANDPEKRYQYILRQSMLSSVREAAAIS